MKVLTQDVFNHVAREAGEYLLRQSQKKGLQVFTKADGSIVTEADIGCSRLIKSLLKDYGYPIVCEEDIPPQNVGLDYILVDPIDGTKAFAAGEPIFGTLIALIKNKKPLIGTANFPKLGMHFYAEKNKGAFLNGQLLQNKNSNSVVAYTSGFHKTDQGKKIIEHLGIKKILEEGSFLKLCRIASGEAHFYIRTGKTCEWDTAACQIILEEAGGHIWLLNNLMAMEYGNSDYTNNDFIAFSDSLHEKVVAFINGRKDLKF